MNIIFSLILLINTSFGSPVNYEITLAGNFGEPRPNHFHDGIDLKTGGVTGKPVFSIGDGYVSHVTIGLSGFGNAVYVHHPEGYTSVYCHLKNFTPWIAAIVRKWQYSHHSYKGDIRFKPTDLLVAKGQLIAISGNTGASEAPHLHFEIHNTRTWDLLDPLDFIGNHVQDTVPPMAHGFMAYPQAGSGIFCDNANNQTFNFTSHNLIRKFTAWGKIGFGLWANDYMQATYNRYGVRYTELYVDRKLIFKSNLNNIPIHDNIMVNAWGDYRHYLRYHVWYMKSFVSPGITLPIFTTNSSNGIINFNRERDYHITYIIKDFKGNTSKYTFTVTGRKTNINKPSIPHPIRTLAWNKPNYYQLPGMQLTIPYGSLANDLELSPVIKFQPEKLSNAYRFTILSTPILRYVPLSLRLKSKVKDVSKLYIVSHYIIDRYIGGTYNDGWVSGKIRELGATYEIAYDDTPPVIIQIGQKNWNTTHIIRFGIQDKGCGIAKYEAYIDNKFVLFEDVPKSQWVRCNLADTPIKKTNSVHSLKFIATDFRNNTKVFNTIVRY